MNKKRMIFKIALSFAGELAHAFLPEAGLVHFDDSEYWTDGNDTSGTNLFVVSLNDLSPLQHFSRGHFNL